MASWGRIHQTIFTVSILYFGTADFVELTGMQTEIISCGIMKNIKMSQNGFPWD